MLKTNSNLRWRNVTVNQTANINETSFIAGRDSIHLYTHYFFTDEPSELIVPDSPVQLVTGGDHRPGVLGIGSSSSILQKLYDLGHIAGRTYSLYIGSAFERAGGKHNGSNVFGGYDGARFTGEVYTYPMDLSSPDYLPVQVTDIIIDHPSNPVHERISIVGDHPFEARITTDRYPMVLPYSVTQQFINKVHAAPAQRSDDFGKSLHLTQPFNGTMTVVLEGGFMVTLPSEAISNPGSISSVVSQSTNYTGPYYLSASWLSQVYLMLDFETQKFHLAQAVPNAPYIQPQTFCPGDTPAPIKTRNLSMEGGRVHIGAIIGAIIGGASLLLAVLTVCFVIKRRHLAREHDIWEHEQKTTVASTVCNKTSTSINDLEMQKFNSPTAVVAPPPTPRQAHVLPDSREPRPLSPRPRSRSISPVSSISRYSTASR
jgi:Eukaryotic aspartyl protease